MAASLTPLGADGASPELWAPVREVAEIAWQRLEYFRALARAEAERVKKVLKKGIREENSRQKAEGSGQEAEGRANSAGRGPETEGARDLAAKLLKAFEPEARRWGETLRLEEELEARFGRLVEKLSIVSYEAVKK